MDKLQEYFDLLPHCILKFQYIEEGLRFCLYRCHGVVAIKLKGTIPYKAPLQSIEKAAMGKLINLYQPFTDDKDFIKSLNSVKAKRDHIAHQGYVLTVEEQHNNDFVAEKLKELIDALEAFDSCYEELSAKMAEIDKLVNDVANEKT